ncbi:MAG: glycosyl transferase family 2, partial [Flavobacteriaceae bacterium]|nr:glycosyl transferase family 2 [Flavobacteriaceae bacterium]
SYLKKNPEVKLLGTWARVIDEKGKYLFNLKHPIKYKKIKKLVYLNSVFLHPSVMFSTSVLREVKQYPLNYFAAEDYAFFFKIIKKYKSENYPEILMDYMVDENSISSKFRKQQVISRIKVISKNFYFGIYPIYGIIRSVILLFYSREISNFIKTKSQKA